MSFIRARASQGALTAALGRLAARCRRGAGCHVALVAAAAAAVRRQSAGTGRGGMTLATRAVSTPMPRVNGRHRDAEALDDTLVVLRERFPGATFTRYLGGIPTVARSAFVFPTAAIVGDVRIGGEASIWYGVVMRGDMNFVSIGYGRRHDSCVCGGVFLCSWLFVSVNGVCLSSLCFV